VFSPDAVVSMSVEGPALVAGGMLVESSMEDSVVVSVASSSGKLAGTIGIDEADESSDAVSSSSWVSVVVAGEDEAVGPPDSSAGVGASATVVRLSDVTSLY
jgi:hypothetical protein